MNASGCVTPLLDRVPRRGVGVRRRVPQPRTTGRTVGAGTPSSATKASHGSCQPVVEKSTIHVKAGRA